MQSPTRTHMTRMPVPDSAESTQDQIRRRAYELYEQRGREDGHDLDDWLKAESEVNREAKAMAAQSGATGVAQPTPACIRFLGRSGLLFRINQVGAVVEQFAAAAADPAVPHQNFADSQNEHLARRLNPCSLRHPASRIGQLLEYRLQLMHLLSYCDPGDAGRTRAEITLIDSFIVAIRSSKRMIVVIDDDPVMAGTLERFFESADTRQFPHPIQEMRLLFASISALTLRWLTYMKLLLISGHPEASDRVAACHPAALHFLERPLLPDELLTTIAGLFDQPDPRVQQAAS